MITAVNKRSFRLIDTVSAAVSFETDDETSDQLAIEVRNLSDMIRRNGLSLTLRHLRLKSRGTKPEEGGKTNSEIRNVIEAVLKAELDVSWQAIESSNANISIATRLAASSLVIDACVLYWRSLIGRSALKKLLIENGGTVTKGIAADVEKYAEQDESKQFIYALPGRIALHGALSTWLFALSKSQDGTEKKEGTIKASEIMITLARIINEETVDSDKANDKNNDAIQYLALCGKSYDSVSRTVFEQRFYSFSVKFVTWVQSQDALPEPESVTEV